jgi:hypothetical protein
MNPNIPVVPLSLLFVSWGTDLSLSSTREAEVAVDPLAWNKEIFEAEL